MLWPSGSTHKRPPAAISLTQHTGHPGAWPMLTSVGFTSTVLQFFSSPPCFLFSSRETGCVHSLPPLHLRPFPNSEYSEKVNFRRAANELIQTFVHTFHLCYVYLASYHSICPAPRWRLQARKKKPSRDHLL